MMCTSFPRRRSLAGLAMSAAFGVERYDHRAATDFEFAGKSIDCLLDDINFGLLSVQRLQLSGMSCQYLGTTAGKSAFAGLDIGSCQLSPHGGDSFCCIGTRGRLRRGKTSGGESLDLFGVLLFPLSLL